MISSCAEPDPSNRTVYLIDDDEAVREALALLLRTLDISVRTFAGPERFLEALPEHPPGCLIVDIRMPGLSGLRLQERLVADGCDWPTVIISGHGNIEACRKAFRNGAVDFLGKPIDEQDLIDAVERGFASLAEKRRLAAVRDESIEALATLTPREREVLDLITRGFSSREVAIALSVSPRTIETHRANLSAKLGTSSVAELTHLVYAAEAPLRM